MIDLLTHHYGTIYNVIKHTMNSCNVNILTGFIQFGWELYVFIMSLLFHHGKVFTWHHDKYRITPYKERKKNGRLFSSLIFSTRQPTLRLYTALRSTPTIHAKNPKRLRTSLRKHPTF